MTDQPLLPNGFRYAGVACGIKASGKLDISLIVAEEGVTAAGVYTQNQIVAAPVLLAKSHTPAKGIRAVITNSGNANACTGTEGMNDAIAMCDQVANLAGCKRSEVLIMSTGVIGQRLPMTKVSHGIMDAYSNLENNADSFYAAAEAIRTTDNDRKVASKSIKVGGRTINIAAMAKGAGMIAPNMATMLAVVLTDAPLLPEDAQSIISSAAEISFNKVSVDGHTSTNDSLLILASGRSKPLASEELTTFASHVNEVCISLAKMLVADGEGATHVMAINVSGADDDAAADEIARTVAASQLVKTAITGGDPNWGRIVSAAGYAKAQIVPEKTSLKVCGIMIYENGSPIEFDAAALSEKMKSSPEVDIDLVVGPGTGKSTFWSSDLTTEYVKFNSEYTT